MDKKANLALGAVSLVLGLVLSLQFKSVLRTKTNDSAQLARAEQLQLELTAEQEKNEALYNQLMQYKEELAQLRIQAEETGGVSDMFAERLRQMELLAGVTDVSGQGVTVTLRDNGKTNAGAAQTSAFAIHEEDLLRVLNELCDAGAEAISLNGERLIATSSVKCTGGSVTVNGVKYSAPYTISAIGSSDVLERALLQKQGAVEVLRQWGIEVEVKKERSITIAGYVGPTDMEYATTAGKE